MLSWDNLFHIKSLKDGLNQVGETMVETQKHLSKRFRHEDLMFGDYRCINQDTS